MTLYSSNPISEIINDCIIAVLNDDVPLLSILIRELDIELSSDYQTGGDSLSIAGKVSIFDSWLFKLGANIEADGFFLWNFKSFLMELSIKTNKKYTLQLLIDMLSLSERTLISGFFETAIRFSAPDSLEILVEALLDGDINSITYPRNRDVLTIALTTPCGNEKALNHGMISHITQTYCPALELDTYSSRTALSDHHRVVKTEVESSMTAIIMSKLSVMDKLNAVRIALEHGGLIEGMEGSILSPLEAAVSVSKPLTEFLLANAEANIKIDYEQLFRAALTSPFTHIFERLEIADLIIDQCSFSEINLYELVERIMLTVHESQLFDTLIYLVQTGFTFEEDRLIEISMATHNYSLIRRIHDNAQLFG